MKNIVEVWNSEIRDFISFESEIVENIDQFIIWLDENDFLAGKTPTIYEEYFTIQIYLFRTALFRLTFNNRGYIYLEKPIRIEANTIKYTEFEKELGNWDRNFLRIQQVNAGRSYQIKELQKFQERLKQFKNKFLELINDLTSSIKIDNIELVNYRRFESTKIQFSDFFNLLIGDNGSGKTAILDAISVAIGAFLSGFGELTSDESRVLKNSKDIRWDGENYQTPCKVSASLKFSSKGYQLSRSLNKFESTMSRSGAAELIVFSKIVEDEIKKGNKTIILPIFAYHGTGRLWRNSKNKIDIGKRITRFSGYLGCLNADSDYKSFVEWYVTKKFEVFTSESNDRNIEIVKAVEQSIITVLEKLNPMYKNAKLEYENADLLIRYQKNRVVPIRLLSDGYRNIIGIVADISYRMAILNPFLKDKLVTETPGIVLIDEIDLHLHPKWQQAIVKVLKDTFTKVQFIATTHSPSVIQAFDSDEIINLSNDNEEYENYKGWSVDEILEYEMGVENTRSIEYQKLIHSFENALDQEDIAKSKEIYHHIIKMIHPNNELRKLLAIELAGIGGDVNDKTE